MYGKITQLFAGLIDGSKRIQKIVQSLKDFARGDSGSAKEWINVNEVVDNAITIVNTLIKKSTENFSVHAGVGATPVVNVQVDWPDGTTTSVNGLATNECYEVKYSTGAATKCKPPVATSVSSNEAAPIAFNLAQNYPNPFSANGRGTFGNPSTVISFQLPVSSHVTLKVFDVNGREVARLVDGEMTAGNHAVTFAPHDVAGGIYFYKLTVGKMTQTRQALLLK
jgi:hypothetical protein